MVMADDQNSDFAATQVAHTLRRPSGAIGCGHAVGLDGDRQKLAKLLVVAQWR
jgi:hypothetical protein